MYKKAGAIGLIPASNELDFIIRVKTSILPFAPLVALVRPPTTPNLRSRNTFQRSGTLRTRNLLILQTKKREKLLLKNALKRFCWTISFILIIFTKISKQERCEISDNQEHVTCCTDAEIISLYVLGNQFIDWFFEIFRHWHLTTHVYILKIILLFIDIYGHQLTSVVINGLLLISVDISSINGQSKDIFGYFQPF